MKDECRMTLRSVNMSPYWLRIKTHVYLCLCVYVYFPNNTEFNLLKTWKSCKSWHGILQFKSLSVILLHNGVLESSLRTNRIHFVLPCCIFWGETCYGRFYVSHMPDNILPCISQYNHKEDYLDIKNMDTKPPGWDYTLFCNLMLTIHKQNHYLNL